MATTLALRLTSSSARLSATKPLRTTDFTYCFAVKCQVAVGGDTWSRADMNM
jgi:hypothetical protein